MQYRKMPKFDDKISALGYGCMRFPSNGGRGLTASIDKEKALGQIRYAIDNGVNYLDTAYPYHRGTSESFLGDYVLKDGYRQKVQVATKLPCFIINKKEKIEEIFEKQLSKLKLDYIDFYLLHSLDGSSWKKMLSFGIIDFMDKIKREGKVRRMGFSFHGTREAFIEIVDGYDWDFAQVQYNIIDENFQAGITGIEYAAGKGLGIIVMEPLRGGALVGKIPKEVKALYDAAPIKRSPADWALRWIYNNPAVTTVLSGMNDYEHIKENIKIASQALPESLTKEELSIIDSVRDKYLELMAVGCTGCGYCLPCPAGINIPGTFNRLNDYHMFGKLHAKIYHMAYTGIMTDDGKPHWTSSCTDCGKCEKACPQHIEIRREFKHVRKHLEGPLMRAIAPVGRFVVSRKKKQP